MRLTVKPQNACIMSSAIAMPVKSVWKVEMLAVVRKQNVQRLVAAVISEKRIFVIRRGEVSQTSLFLLHFLSIFFKVSRLTGYISKGIIVVHA